MQSKWNVVKVIGDIVLFPVVVIIAYGLKFKAALFFEYFFSIRYGSVYDHAQLEPYLQHFYFLILLWIFAALWTKLYSVRLQIMSEVDEIIAIFKTMVLFVVLVMATSFFYPVFPSSKTVLVNLSIIGVFILTVFHLLISYVESLFVKKGLGCQRVLVMGANAIGQDMVEKILKFPAFRLFYVGTLDDEVPDKIHYHLRDHFLLLGSFEDYQLYIETHHIDQVFVCKERDSLPCFQALKAYCRDRGVSVHVYMEDKTDSLTQLKVHDFDDLSFYSESKYSLGIGYFVMKRVFDLLLVVIMGVCLWPVLFVIAMLILVTSKGGVFYIQERVGYLNKSFYMVKFRTMYHDAEKHGPQLVDEVQETRYTVVGKWLRRFSLDELPQLWNILKGDMSFVGPRPERPFFVEQYSKESTSFRLRHSVYVGLTGWAQINGRSVLTNRPSHKLKYDLYYIRHWSFLLDIKILIKTIFVVFRGVEAY